MAVSLRGSFSFSSHGKTIEDYFIAKSGTFRRDAFAETLPRPILLCFTNRCGSTLVAAEASAWGFCGKPNHRLNYEFFNSDFVIECCNHNAIASFQKYVEFIAREYVSPLGTWFSKVSIDQLAWLSRIGAFETALADPLIISVMRRNILAQAISFVIAEQTGEWTSFHPTAISEPSINPDRVIEMMTYISQLNAEAEVFFNLTNPRLVRFIYEEVVEHLAQVRDRLEHATGLRAAKRSERTLDVRLQRSGINREWERQIREQIAELMPPIRSGMRDAINPAAQ